jgi:hypothetical protein
LSLLALVLSIVNLRILYPEHQPLKLALPFTLIILSLCLVGLGFYIRYERAAPIRFAQSTLASLKVPPQFGSKSVSTLPGDFDHPGVQWETRLSALQACQELPAVMTSWQQSFSDTHGVIISQPNRSNEAGCEFTGILHGLAMSVSVYVDSTTCTMQSRENTPVCRPISPTSNTFVLASVAAKTPY